MSRAQGWGVRDQGPLVQRPPRSPAPSAAISSFIRDFRALRSFLSPLAPPRLCGASFPPFLLSTFAFLLFTWAPAHAAPTKLLSYQGRVTDANGQPIADGAYTLRFKIYTTLADCNADSASNLAWGPETHDGGAGNPAQAQVTNGLFSAVLGTDVDTPLNSSFDADYWLQLKVGANPVFTPCDRLTTTPYAIRAIDANTAVNAQACNADATCETTGLTVSANTTLGDTSGDSVTVNAGTFNLANTTTTSLNNVANAWNIDSNTLSVDALNNRVGFGTAAPSQKLEVSGGNVLVSQNNYISLGDGTNRALLSSGGGYTHLGYNAWYNGAAWQEIVDANVDLMVQFDAVSATKAITFYYAPGAVGPPAWSQIMTVDQNSNVTATTFTGNLACTDCVNATEIEDLFVFNSGDTMTGDLNMGTDGAGRKIYFAAQDGVNEGGELTLNGSGANADWNIDNYLGRVRMHTGGTTYFDIDAGNTLTVTGDVRASKGIRAGGTGDVTDGEIVASGDIYTTNPGGYAQTKLQQWGLLGGAGGMYLEPGSGQTLWLTDQWDATGKVHVVMDRLSVGPNSTTENARIYKEGHVTAATFSAWDYTQATGPGTGADNQDHAALCPLGYAMYAIEIYATGSYLDGNITVFCYRLGSLLNTATDGESVWGPGTGADNQWHDVDCQAGRVARGIRIRANSNLDGNMRLICTALAVGSVDTGYSVASDNANWDNVYHGAHCHPGTYVRGISIYAAAALDGRMYLRCRAPKP